MPNQPRKPTPAEVEAIRAGNAAGKSTYLIAKELGISRGHISRWSPDLGLSWDRSKTAAAGEARRQECANKRAQLELDYLDDAQRFRAKCRQPFTYVFVTGKVTMPEPYPSDQRAFQQMSIASMTASLRIAEHDSGVNIERGRSLLADVAAALAVDTGPPTDDDDEAEG
jgi:hypothetical protein